MPVVCAGMYSDWLQPVNKYSLWLGLECPLLRNMTCHMKTLQHLQLNANSKPRDLVSDRDCNRGTTTIGEMKMMWDKL